MRTKTAVIASVAWFVAVVVAGIALGVYMSGHPVRGMSNEERAAKLGGGLGTLCGIGLGTIWAVWLVKRQRAQQRKTPAGPRRKIPRAD